MAETEGNTRMDLILALNYSGKADITRATKQIAYMVQQGDITLHDVNDELISSSLFTAGIPDPELMIRTSGEQRISNFSAVGSWRTRSFYFTEKFWPDFDKEELYNAILTFQKQGAPIWQDIRAGKRTHSRPPGSIVKNK